MYIPDNVVSAYHDPHEKIDHAKQHLRPPCTETTVVPKNHCIHKAYVSVCPAICQFDLCGQAVCDRHRISENDLKTNDKNLVGNESDSNRSGILFLSLISFDDHI